jgi:hypothetical protein
VRGASECRARDGACQVPRGNQRLLGGLLERGPCELFERKRAVVIGAAPVVDAGVAYDGAEPGVSDEGVEALGAFAAPAAVPEAAGASAAVPRVAPVMPIVDTINPDASLLLS